MSEPHIDPAGNTQQFRAFAQRHDQETAAQQRERSYVVPIIVAVVLVAIAAAVTFVLLT
ncbi:hypothetical protein [Thermostaphylospora chromogena]|nr:hypothetical protein [Thermostaphylospora chromogena]